MGNTAALSGDTAKTFKEECINPNSTVRDRGIHLPSDFAVSYSPLFYT